MKQILSIILILAAICTLSESAGWKNLECGTSDCLVQFSELNFEPNTAKLSGFVENLSDEPIPGGTLRMVTQGYGCLWFLCTWADGPVLEDPTCDWEGMCDHDTVCLLLVPHNGECCRILIQVVLLMILLLLIMMS
eukprot:TRINITY_DN974_c0_g1_i1.p1 TRINITY_DN974_c0_g1~~TRINITY_DN974_c0_g1_i1.p1  ORF type:complete len:136 (-),score=24.50 TRINITY_DN974_c0_g1_i1:83-490(-)